MTRVPDRTAEVPAPGFADWARDAQRAFRSILDALAHPTRAYPLTGPATPPATLGRGVAAAALTLLDEDCTVWLGGGLADDDELAAWLRFHTGAHQTAEADAAQFVFTAAPCLPPLGSLALGSDEAPHLSATVVLDTRGCRGSSRFTAEGPGIDGVGLLEAPWAQEGFLAQWDHNTSLFPRGVDLLLVGEDQIVGLPRSTRLAAEA